MTVCRGMSGAHECENCPETLRTPEISTAGQAAATAAVVLRAGRLPQVRAPVTALCQQSPKALCCVTLPNRLVTITSPGPMPYRPTCALISLSTHRSAGKCCIIERRTA
jgi:hypothetical protein